MAGTLAAATAAPGAGVGVREVTERVIGRPAHVDHAFGTVSGSRRVLGDVEADTNESSDATSTVDGTADRRDAATLPGNRWWGCDTPSTAGGKVT